MQTAVSTLPELYALRTHCIASPALRARYRTPCEAKTLRCEAYHDILSGGNGLALGGYSGSDTTLVGAHGEVGIARFGWELLDRPLDVDLTLELVPEEADGYMRIGSDLLPLATLIARIEDEASIFDLFE